MLSEGQEGLRFIIGFGATLGLIFAVGWAWRRWSQSWTLQIGDPKPIKPLQAPKETSMAWRRGFSVFG
jgi:hypothetical protein